MRMTMNRRTPSFLLATAIITLSTLSPVNLLAQSDVPALLTIGSKAPTLDIETWFSDREGEFQHTTEFEPGKIYVIDFWASWSAPSHRLMSTYSELQDRYFDDGVQIISISDEDEDSVANFLELDMNDNSGMIYAEQTLNYCVTTDPDRSVFEDYMEASQQTTIPTVFVVGKTGLIEWFGRPAKLKRTLKRIIDGKWDRDDFKKKVLAQQKMQKLATEVQRLTTAGDNNGALDIIEKMIESAEDAKTKAEMEKLRLSLMMRIDSPKLAAAFKAVVEQKDMSSHALNELAWSIVTREQGGKKIKLDLLDVALETAERAAKIARSEEDDDQLGMILDTVAHLVHLKGDLDKAIEIQTEACEFTMRSDVQQYLEELHVIKAKQDNEEEVAPPEGDTKADDADETEPAAAPNEDSIPAEPQGIES